MNGKIIVTGNGWVGGGFESIGSVFQKLINEATTEIMIGMYTISGAADFIFECLEKALIRGVRVVILVNRFNKQDISAKNYISRLRYSYLNLEVYSFESENEKEDFHAKVTVVDRKRAIIGSSNMSFRGLTANHELATYIEGIVADEAAKALEKLIVNRVMQKI